MVILVVDDDPELREVLGQVLEDAGYQVTLAANGQEALELVRGGCAPNIIVLDVQMPVMDGWHFLSARLQEPSLITIPIILMSACAEHRERGAGVVSEFLSKPLHISTLVAAIDRCRRMLVNLDDHLSELHEEARHGRRVLVVEDDADTREAIKDALEGAHFRVRTAKQGREALDVLHELVDRSLLPTVIICDLRMPVMDGWRLWLELRQDPILSSVPMIIVSANAYELDKLGDEVLHLAKPVELDALLRAIDSAIAA